MDKNGIMETLRSSWFFLAFIGGVIWWAAQQSSAIDEIKNLMRESHRLKTEPQF